MKNLFTVFLFLLIGSVGFAQTLTITSPSGMTPPYEVSSGTVVTVQWDYFDSQPTYMFTYDEDPGSNLNSDWQFNVNPLWSSGSGWTNNGDDTWSWDVTITEDTWIFGAYNAFMGNSYSNVINVNIASGIVIDFEDGLICASGDTETLTVAGTHTAYQWYMDGVIIDGETSSTYDATTAGSYYCIVDDVQSNVLVVEEFVIDFTGAINAEGTELTLTADAGYDSYQWYSGTDVGSMTAISGATNQDYVATLTSTLTYYHIVGTSGTCNVTSIDKSADLDMFTPAVVSVNADTNGFGNICVGSTITVSIDDATENFTWYKNGSSSYYTTTYINITSTWSAGEYYVIINPVEWPEIAIQSNTIDASYYELFAPVLYGVDNNSYHCAGEELTLDLTDEGYTYTWYAHEGYTYHDTDLVTVINNSYTFTFESAIRITVVGSYQGCEAKTTISLNDYANVNMYVGISNYNQQYLCTDSTAHIGISYNEENFVDFQWYQQDGEDWILISGETTHLYGATEPGFYRLNATSAFCPTAFLESNTYQVKDYLDRNLNLYSNVSEMCLGDTATLNMYSNSWTTIQWLKGDIIMGSQGYEMIYVPVSGAGSESSQEVLEFNRYIVKARHNSCPNGLKDSSDPKMIKPSVNPEVLVDMSLHAIRLALWDSSIFYIDCIGNEFTFSIDEDIYDSYQWYDLPYAGLDDYEIGNIIEGETSDSITAEVQVQWLTAEVTLDGCIGYTDPILLDGWAFLSPVVQSYNDGQICEGDSALVNLGFPGTWIEYYWTQDGEIIPDSDNDSLWVTEPGQYVIWAYPEACPTALFTSGVGPTLEIFEALIFEEVDEFGEPFFYAWPWQGNFEFQWYIDGVAYDNTSDIPAVLWKEGLPGGMITVEILNLGDSCVTLSEGFIWNPAVGIDENNDITLSIYPNPSNGLITIEGLDPTSINSVLLYNTQGKVVRAIEVNSEFQKVDITDLPKGMYLLRVMDNEGATSTYTVNKL